MLVLVIEDEVDLATTLEYNLRAEGFTVRIAHSGRQGLASATADPLPDVIVLDLMLPDLSGTEICRKLREGERTRDIPVVMCTAKGEEIDRVVGFEVGADDYVVKPFVVREVVLRVTALAKRLAERRARPAVGDPSRTVVLGSLELDPVSHDVRLGGTTIQLRPLEFKLLQMLVGEPGRVFSREELLEQVWEMRGDINTRTVDVHVRRLRVSLGAAADVIETVHGFGYRARRDGA